MVFTDKVPVKTEARISSIELLEENSWKLKGTMLLSVGIEEFTYPFEARMQLHTPGYVLRVEEFDGAPDGRKLFEAFFDIARSKMPNAMKLSEALAKITSPG